MELTDVISHPLMEVVLQLEYVVSWSGVAIVPVDTPTRSTRRGSTVKVREERERRERGKRRGAEGVVACRQLLTWYHHCIFPSLLSSLLLSLLSSSHLALLHPLHYPHPWLGSMAAMHVRHSPGRRMPRLH